MTINSVIDEFLIEQRVKGNTAKTVEYYESSLHRFTKFYSGENGIETIDLPLLRKYSLHLQDGNLSSISIQTYVRALRAFLTWCYNENILPVNYPEKYKLPKGQRKVIDVLTKDEIEKLFSCFNPNYLPQLRNLCICSLMLGSGLRMNEVVTLRISNLKLAEGQIIVDGKGNEQRIVPLSDKSKKYILKYMRARVPLKPADADLLFLRSGGEPITIETVKNIFRKLKKKTGITRLRAHLLRHTFATLYLENGGDIYSLQSILGHTSLEMVKRYVHNVQRVSIKKFRNYSPLDNL